MYVDPRPLTLARQVRDGRGAMGRHPFFASPLPWALTLDQAKAAAAAQHAAILVVHGHRMCGGTRALVERTLRKEELVEFVDGRFVMLTSDSDAPADWLLALLPELAKTEPTPLCIYLRADGTLLTSTAGGRPPAVLLNDMMQALSSR